MMAQLAIISIEFLHIVKSANYNNIIIYYYYKICQHMTIQSLGF